MPVGDHATLADILEDRAAPSPLDLLAETDQASHVERSVEQLPAREREVIRLRSGLGGREPETLDESATLRAHAGADPQIEAHRSPGCAGFMAAEDSGR